MNPQAGEGRGEGRREPVSGVYRRRAPSAVLGQRAGWARTASSFTSVPQPGPDGSLRCPRSILGATVTRSSYQGTKSLSISIIRRFGTVAAKCVLIVVASGL